MIMVLDLFTIVAVSLGLVLFLAGVVGLLRLPDPLSRLHALTKADNLGLGLVILGLLAQVDWPFGALKLIALWVLVVVSGSVAGQLLASTQHDLLDTAPARAPDQSADRSQSQR
jgi:multicomponent Na+:H+ antiporter subunit G